MISVEEGAKIFEQVEKRINMTPEEFSIAARKFLFENQEAYVAQWIIQNPFANISDYKLKFEYNDMSLTGYTVQMVKIEE